MRADGYGISTTGGLVDLTKPLPRVDASSPFYTFANEEAQSAVYISITAMKGQSALLAMQRVEGFPIYAVSLRPTSEIVGRWRQIMFSHLVLGLPATLGLLLLSLKVWRDQRRLAESNADLLRDNALTADRLFRTKQFGLVGTFEFDLRTGVSRRSAEYMSIHGLPAVATPENSEEWLKRVHPEDRDRAEHELWRALSDPGATLYGQTYRIITPSGEVRWIAARAEIARDEAGTAIMMRGAHVDVTPLRAAELALAESDGRLRLAQEAVGIGSWEWRTRTRFIECSRRVPELLGVAAASRLSLDALFDRVHPEDRRKLRTLLRRGGRDGGAGCEFRIRRPAAVGEPDTAWLAARAKQLSSSNGAPDRLMGIAYDITESKRAEEMLTLTSREVEHRAKNALMIVTSLLRMSKADSAEDLAKVMEGRIRAIGQTISLLSQGRWQGAQLRDIVESELEPYRSGATGDGGKIELCGPPVVVDADIAQPLAMALHELATNAAKYGALAASSGRLEVNWRVESGRIELLWRERGGPPLSGPPLKSGFGSRLIKMLFEGQIAGTIVKEWEPEGLVCEMSFRDRPR
jgi:PAS domain S-box-containing protein